MVNGSLTEGREPGELFSHYVDIRQIAAYIVVAAPLAGNQPETVSCISLARPCATQMNHYSQVLFPLKRDKSISSLPDCARNSTVQPCGRQLNGVTWHNSSVKTVEPARIHISPGTIKDHLVIVNAVTFGFAKCRVGDLVHPGCA